MAKLNKRELGKYPNQNYLYYYEITKLYDEHNHYVGKSLYHQRPEAYRHSIATETFSVHV